MTGGDIFGLVLETLILIGLVSAAACLVGWLLLRSASGALLETTAIILPSAGRPDAEPAGLPTARWMSDDGSLFSRELAHHEHNEIGGQESVTVYYSRRSPDTIRFARRSEAERAVFVLFAITAIIGVASFVASMILLVVEG